MMKMNKKFLTRLFALLASLVLVLALAIPCFADDATVVEETPAPVQKILTEYNFEDYAEFYSYVIQMNVPEFLFPATNTVYLNLQFGSFVYGNGGSIDAVIYSNRTYILTTFIDTSVVLTDEGATVVTYNGITDAETQVYTIEQLDALITSYSFWVYQELQIPETPDTPETPNEPIVPENGWYSQIKNIIKEAVFGQDAVLNDSQEFTINQISLWLTLVVILLPLIVGAVILVRCFR